jgi:hypothetical protein
VDFSRIVPASNSADGCKPVSVQQNEHKQSDEFWNPPPAESVFLEEHILTHMDPHKTSSTHELADNSFCWPFLEII